MLIAAFQVGQLLFSAVRALANFKHKIIIKPLEDKKRG